MRVFGAGAAGKAPTFDLNTFTFNGHTLRTVMIDGKSWFFASDVLGAIGGSRSHGANTRRILDECEFSTINYADFRSGTNSQVELMFPSSNVRGRPTRAFVVSESGLYKIIMRAQRKNPAAREFQDWVTKEVIPRIRKDGGYIMGEEKVATGEITAEQAEANLWKVFAAKLRNLDEEVLALTKAANSARAENGPIFERQKELRELLKRGEEEIAQNEARAGEIVKRLTVVKWQRDRIEEAKRAIHKAENPGEYGVAA